jgi:hypothetical protein
MDENLLVEQTFGASIVDPVTGQAIRTLGNNPTVNPKGDLTATSRTALGGGVLYDSQTYEQVGDFFVDSNVVMGIPPDIIYDMAFSADGRFLITRGLEIHIWAIVP